MYMRVLVDYMFIFIVVHDRALQVRTTTSTACCAVQGENTTRRLLNLLARPGLEELKSSSILSW
jgi:hypothetical protein